MDATEQLVRWRLGVREIKRNMEYLQKHPEYRDAMSRAMKQYTDAVVGALSKTGSLSAEEVEDTRKDIAEKMKELISLEGMIETFGRSYFNSADVLEKEIDKLVAEVEKGDELSKSGFESLKNQLYDYVDFVKIRDIMVTRLTEIVKEKGIEEAVKDETIYKVKRDLFPTEQDYRNYIKRGRKYGRIIFEGLSNFSRSLKEEEKGIVFRNIFSGMNVINDVFFDLQEGQVEEEIREIYSHRPQHTRWWKEALRVFFSRKEKCSA